MCMLTQYTSSVYFWFVLMIVLVSYCRRSSWDSMSIALGSLTLSLLSVLSLPNREWDSGYGDSKTEISKEYVDVVRDAVAKAMCHEGEESWDVESQHDTDM